jgi:hypothetical protein
VASYPAVIELRVDGVTQVTRVLDTISKLDNALVSIKKTPIAIDSGKAVDGIRVLKKEVDDFARKLTTGQAQLASTTAGINSQGQAFKLLAANVKIGSESFKIYTQAAEQAFQKSRLTGGLAEIKAISDLFKVGRTAPSQSFKGIEELLNLGKKIPSNVASLQLYGEELERVLNLVDIGGKEFRQLEQAIHKVDMALGRVQFGPVEPPKQKGTQKTGATANRLESIALGVGFPLLFGGSGGEVLGSLAGSFVGSGFGGQILGGAIGGVLDDFATKASKIGVALNPVTKDIEGLVAALGGSATAAGACITKLEALGRTQEALATAAAELERLVGRGGVVAFKTFGDDASKLGVSFAQAMTQMQASVAALINSTGILKNVIQALEYGVLLRQAMESKDPKLQALKKERDKAAGPGFLGGSPARLNEVNDKLVQQQRLLNEGKVKQYELQRNIIIKEETYYEILKETAKLNAEIAKSREDASDKVRAAQIQELEQRKQLALTLTDELSAVNSMYTQKKQGIDATYAATQRESSLKVELAAKDLASAKAQQARGKATAEETIKIAEQVEQAQKVYDTAVAVTQETLRGAAAVSQAAMSAANLEQRQQTVAAYTAQFASEAGRATNALNEAAAASANQASYAQALTQAQTTINNVNIQSLQTTLATTKNISERARIIDKIKTLEIDNARLAYLGTVSQIKAQLESLRIAYKQVEVKYLELQAVVAVAKAQGLLNRGYIDALDAQRSALRIAAGNLATGEKIARVNGQAAVAVYNGAVSAAKLRASTALAAQDAGSFAGSMDRAATSMQRAAGVNLQGFSGLEPWMEAKIAQAKQGGIATGNMNSISGYYAGVNAEIQLRSQFEQILRAKNAISNKQSETAFWSEAASLGFSKFATGGYVTGPTMGLIGEGGQSEYIIPSSKMAQASANYLAGGRGAGIMEGGSGGGSAPSINITTGPVIEFNGERYVTMRDMERGLQQMAANIYTGLRTPAGRYAVGTR